MAKQSPHQFVKVKHGSKAKLAEKVLGFLETPEGEDQADFEARITKLSNAKLVRLFNAHEKVESVYGGKQALVDKIVSAKFKGGNEPYAKKIATFSEPRLLDLARQAGV